jgi:hypothetical protein
MSEHSPAVIAATCGYSTMSKPRIIRVKGAWVVGRWRWIGLTGHKMFQSLGEGKTIQEAWGNAFPPSLMSRFLARVRAHLESR